MDDVIFINYESFLNSKKDITPDLRLQEKINSISLKSDNSNNGYKKKKFLNKINLPKHLDVYKKESTCYKRRLNSLMNKINENNFNIIMKDILSIIDSKDKESIEMDDLISILIEKAYISRQYTYFLLTVLKESMKKNNDLILNKIQNSHETKITLFDSKIEDIIYLSGINSYDEFCDCNKKKKDLLNWGKATMFLIKENMLENFTVVNYFDFIYFKLCEYISYEKNAEILIDIILEFVNEMTLSRKDCQYRHCISNFYSRNIKQKMNKRCQFKFESIIYNTK